MYDDWNTDLTGIDAGNKGYPANGDTYPETFRQQVTMLTAAGIHVGAHAVGDRGIDFVVDTFAEALKAHPTKDYATRSFTPTCRRIARCI